MTLLNALLIVLGVCAVPAAILALIDCLFPMPADRFKHEFEKWMR